MAIEQNDGKQFYLDDGYNFNSIVVSTFELN